MSVSVNSFILCIDIKNPNGQLRDFISGPINIIFPKNGNYPLECPFKGYFQLRRDSYIGDLDFVGLIKCTDEDSKPLFRPIEVSGNFGDGNRFFAADFGLKMTIPKVGYYEIQFELFNFGMPETFTYGFEAKENGD